MGKVSAAARDKYTDTIRPYKQEIEQILQHEKSILAVIEKSDDPPIFQHITLAEDRLNLAALYLLLNRISQSMLGLKNDTFLNDARKCCYESIIHFEQVVTDQIDVAFSDLDEVYKALDSVSDRKRYELMQKLGFTIDSVIQAYGKFNRFQYSFVELNARFATVYKNIINFKTIVAGLDPRMEDYEIRGKMLQQVKALLEKAADDYRLKYETATSRIDDFKVAIRYLSALRRIHLLLGESDPGENVKKKADVWKSKMDDDERQRKAEDRK
jgi:hypothetical protein